MDFQKEEFQTQRLDTEPKRRWSINTWGVLMFVLFNSLMMTIMGYTEFLFYVSSWTDFAQWFILFESVVLPIEFTLATIIGGKVFVNSVGDIAYVLNKAVVLVLKNAVVVALVAIIVAIVIVLELVIEVISEVVYFLTEFFDF